MLRYGCISPAGVEGCCVGSDILGHVIDDVNLTREVAIVVMQVNDFVHAYGKPILVGGYIGPDIPWIHHPAFLYHRTIGSQDDSCGPGYLLPHL